MRKIFHAWGDETCKEILLNAKAGMTDQSVLLIDEIVFPERGATVQGAQMDIELMICAGMCPGISFAPFGTFEHVCAGMPPHTGPACIITNHMHDITFLIQDCHRWD